MLYSMLWKHLQPELSRALRGDYSAPVRAVILAAYEQIFGKKIPNQNCQSCLHDAAVEILVKMKDTKKYVLKSRYPVVVGKNIYTHATITDEIAEEFLAKNPDKTYMFARIQKAKPQPKVEPEKTEENETVD